MIYILATIVISVFLLILFKIFELYNVNSFVAIIVNYIVAALTGIIFLNESFTANEIFSAKWSPIAVPLGAIFISIFYLISQTAQRISMATASVANKMSVVIPVMLSVFYLHEELSLLKVAGIGMALLAVYLSSYTGNANPLLRKLIWLPILVFIGSGLIDATINYTNAVHIKSKHDSALFTTFTFFSAFCVGLVVIAYLLITRKLTAGNLFNIKNIVGGIALGIPNYFSIYFIFKSLDTNLLSSAQLFPVLNLCNVALASVCGWIIFKEKLSVINIAGILLALLSIVLIAL